MYLKQSTASQSVLIGPFVDETDGKTAETGLTIANTDIRLSKNGGNMAAKNSGGGTHDEAGWYTMTLDATDTDTVGRLQVSVHVAGALPVWMNFDVLEETVYDALIGSGAAGELAVKLSTQGKADVNAEADTALTDYDAVVPADLPTNFGALAINASGHVSRVTLVDTTTTNTDMRGTDSAALASVCTEGRLAELDAANLPADIDAILVDTNELQGDWANGGRLDLILDARASQASVDTIDGNVDAILVDTDTTIPGLINGLNDLSAAEVNAEVDTALSDIHLDHLLAVDYDPASKPGVATALLNELVESDVGVSRFTANALEEAPTGGSAPTVEQIRAEMDANSTQFAAIVADTNELQTDWANGGRLDLILDARASQASVDSLNDLSTGDVDARLAAIGLDHLVSAAVIGTDVADNSIVAKLASKGATADWDTFANTTDSLQAIRDNHPTNFGTFSIDESGAVQVAGFVSGAINSNAIAGNAITAAAVAPDVIDEIWEEPIADHGGAGTVAKALADVNNDLADGGRLDLLIDAIKAKTDDLPASVFTTAMTEAYRATGATGTIAQLLYELVGHLGNSAISGTTKTVNKLDKTAAKTYTLDDDSTPSAIEETT